MRYRMGVGRELEVLVMRVGRERVRQRTTMGVSRLRGGSPEASGCGTWKEVGREREILFCVKSRIL